MKQEHLYKQIEMGQIVGRELYPCAMASRRYDIVDEETSWKLVSLENGENIYTLEK
jgi:hypothetical protein